MKSRVGFASVQFSVGSDATNRHAVESTLMLSLVINKANLRSYPKSKLVLSVVNCFPDPYS